jgi:phosphate transport system protein
MLASILKVSTELERIGDYAKGIAHMTMQTGQHPAISFPDELAKMALCSVYMLQRALSAFIEMDEASARIIPDMDAEVDAYYNRINRSLMEMIGQNPATINSATDLMWASHNLERMADRVTNICELTVFVATGKQIQLDISDRKITVE